LIKKSYDPIPVNNSFPNKQLAAIKVTSWESPLYVDYANFIISKYFPPTFTAQQRRKLLYDLRHYFWDDPHLYKEGVGWYYAKMCSRVWATRDIEKMAW
jgi:hypothetical protein